MFPIAKGLRVVSNTPEHPCKLYQSTLTTAQILDIMWSLFKLNQRSMGMRKKVRTKQKADRKVQIRKISAQRLKKAQKAAEKEKAASKK